MYNEVQMRECPYCSYQTEKASTLSMHISMKHSNKRKHECPECHLRFSQKTQLEHHFLNHHSDSDIECPDKDCTMRFKTHTNQQIHYVRKHMDAKTLFAYYEGNEYECLFCDYIGKPAAMYYHAAHCSPCSPFYNTSAMRPIKRRRMDTEDEDEDEDESEDEQDQPVQEVHIIPDPNEKVDQELERLANIYDIVDESFFSSFCFQ